MEDFESKYTGEEVENLLDQVATGGGGTSGYAGMPVVEVADLQLETTYVLQPNTYYRFTGQIADLGLNLGTATAGVVNEYVVEINSPSVEELYFTTNNTITWANGEAPTFANPTVISIINGLGVWAEFTTTE